MRRARLQPLENRLRLGVAAGLRGRRAQKDLRRRRVESERDRLGIGSNGLRVLALCGIRVTEEEGYVGILRVQLDRLVQHVYRLVESTSGRKHQSDGRVDSG